MICSRWIALCVDSREHPVVGMQLPPPPAADKNTHAQAPFAAWIDLLSEARSIAKSFSNKGKVMALERGQFIAGRAFWSKRWNWTENAVRGFFSRLVENGMIEFSHQSEGHSANVASICNYDAYQYSPLANDQSNHQSSTSNPPDSYKDTSLRENKTEGAREGETHVGMGVYVNCETIRHRDFTISLTGIQLQTQDTIPMEEIKSVAAGIAVGWATSIAAGKRGVVPNDPTASVRGSIQNQRIKAEVGATRKRRAAEPYKPVTEAKPLKMDPMTPRYARPAEEPANA